MRYRRPLFSNVTGRRARSPLNRLPTKRPLRCESLEARRLLTSYLVDTVSDSIAEDGFISLREAIQAANTNAAVGDAPAGEAGASVTDTIRFAPSLAGMTLSLDGAELAISDSLEISADVASRVTIDAGGDSRVLNVLAGSSDVTLRNLIITGGDADIGGGLLLENTGFVTLDNVDFVGNEARGNAATQGGGGVFSRGSSLTIVGGLFVGNSATGTSGSGGGLFSANGDVIVRETAFQSNVANRAGGGIEIGIGNVVLTDVLFGGDLASQGNVTGPTGSAAPGNGGALHVTGDGGATVTSVAVTGGRVLNNIAASEGGGLWNARGATMSISGGTFIAGNRANGATNTEGGGGVFNNGGVLNIADAEITNNATLGAAGGGGGVLSDGGLVTIDNTLIASNFAAGGSGSGGGLLAITTAKVNIVDSEISGNVASRAGGGIEIATAAATGNALTLIGVNLSDNNAGVVDEDATAAAPGNGGGLHVTGPGNVLIVDSLVTENIAASEGGGLWNGGGQMQIENTQILRNVASGAAADNGGGGVFNEGGLVTINGSTISENIADGAAGSGGGILGNGGRVRVVDTMISSNTANRAGGGIEMRAGGILQLDRVDLIDNVAGPTGSAAPGNGGGLHVTGAGDTTIVGGIVRGNLAASEGGGLWNDDGTMTIAGTLITRNIASGNLADNGGAGVFNDGGTLVISSATITSNVADGTAGSGGGVFVFGGDATITDTLVRGNVANRAGGGIEATANSDTTLNNVNLNGNNAGVAVSASAATASLLAYLFDETGVTASPVDPADPLLLFNANGGAPADLHSGPGTGVTGLPGDRAFDNTASSGITNGSGGRHAVDFDEIDGLSTFTLSGWFKLPETATESIGRQDALIENGTIVTQDAPGGFRLRGGPVANAGTLELTVNKQMIESASAYQEIGEYVYFAVSYDGTTTANNVKFYKGTLDGGVTFVDTRTLNAGPAANEAIPLSIGVTRSSGLTTNPFNGLLDDLRIDGSVLTINELESRRFAATALSTSIAANPGNGGGLHISGNGIVRINDGTVNGNLAANEGGGLWNSTTGNLFVNGTLISGNSAVDGGGVYTDGGNTVLTDVNVTGNTASQSGGGVYVAASDSGFASLTVTDSAIQSNTALATAAGLGGGGIFAGGSAVLTDTDIVNNTATAGTADGGGVLIDGGDFSLTDFSTTGGEISGNRAARAGGGVENNGGFFTAVGTDFINNFAGVNGGALHQSTTAGEFGTTSLINDAIVRDNVAVNEGGGFWGNGNADPIASKLLGVSDSTFTNNLARFGGAIFGDGTADVTVDRTTFTGNTAETNGGAIAIELGSLFIADATFTANTAGGNAPGLGGGAIFTGAANQIVRTDVINNSAAMPMGNGGGILVAATGTGTFFGGLIQGNVAGRAGGGAEVIGQITFDQGFESATAIPLAMDNNRAGINGGGLHISGSGDVTIRRSSVTNNVALSEGGGLWNSAAGTLTVDTVTIDLNLARGNDADQGGGGIFSDGGTTTVNASTISNNLADGALGSGGGILSKGNLTVTQSAINNNIAVRAGGGIEIFGDVVTVLTDVNLDDNSAGLDRSRAGANIPAPLLAYNFNETGTMALATGSAADVSGNPTLNLNANGSTAAADLHSPPGTGVSGDPGDRAFDNTNSSGFQNASKARHAADFDAIDTLSAFTLSGWYRLPSTAGPIGLQDALIENGSTSSGFRLRGGNSTNAATLQLTVDGTTRETPPVYTEVGEYVYFAVSYDGTLTSNNVRFYKGTTSTAATLVGTFSINAGTVNAETLPLALGISNVTGFNAGSFNGLLDNIRIDGSALPIDSLEFIRADAAGQATGLRAAPGNGGGLHVTGAGTIDITGGTVSRNFAASEGGGLWNGSGVMTVDGTTITDNAASGDDADNGGGGIFNNDGTLVVNNANIQDNLADGTNGSGGGIFSVVGDVTVTGGVIEANGANRAGGGIEIVDGTLTLNGVDLNSNDAGGNITGGTAAPGNGGGLHVTGVANVIVDGGRVIGNVAAREGGGLWNQIGSTLTVRNGTLIEVNVALGAMSNQGGGGVFNNGGTVDISDAMILSNFADGAAGSGGGILNTRGGVVTVTDTTISRNIASRAGGGIEDVSVSGTTPVAGNQVTLTRVVLDRNNAGVVLPGRAGAVFSAPGNGGGLHITGAGNVLISESIIADNVAANEGGGLWNSVGTMTVDRSTVLDNSAPKGGGLFNDSTSGDIVLTNSTISGNEADSGGGIETEGGNVSLTSVTVAFNDADQGGGINVIAGTVTIGSSIVASNTAGIGPNVSGAATSNGFNIFGTTTGATLAGTSASDRLDVAAGLAPLANNGGPTMTHALLPGSPALGNGNPAGLATDQRGVARPQGGGADSGAFESSSVAIAPPVVAPERLAQDVDGNGTVSALDALMVINHIGRGDNGAAGEPVAEGESSPMRVDVNADGRVTALDALMVINYLGRLPSGESATSNLSPASDLIQATPIGIPSVADSILAQRRRDIDDLLLEELAADVINARSAF